MLFFFFFPALLSSQQVNGPHIIQVKLGAEDEPTAPLESGNYWGGHPHSAHVSGFSPNSLLKQTINSFNLPCQGNNGPWH